jgi:hypothetical protein
MFNSTLVNCLEPVKMAARSKVWTVFAHSNTGIVGSTPTWGLDVCVRLFCVCAVQPVASRYTNYAIPAAYNTSWGFHKIGDFLISLATTKFLERSFSMMLVPVCDTPYNLAVCVPCVGGEVRQGTGREPWPRSKWPNARARREEGDVFISRFCANNNQTCKVLAGSPCMVSTTVNTVFHNHATRF